MADGNTVFPITFDAAFTDQVSPPNGAIQEVSGSWTPVVYVDGEWRVPETSPTTN